MEEILELKNCLLNQQYDLALAIVEDLEAMGRQDKINNLESWLLGRGFNKNTNKNVSIYLLINFVNGRDI